MNPTLGAAQASYYVNRMVLSVQESNVLRRLAARSQRSSRLRQAGFSLIELLIVIAIILIILSVALPQMSKSRMHAQEMAAIEEMGTINKAEIQYYSQFNQYATSLAQLGPPATAGAAEGPAAAGLIPGSLASGAAGGYNFTVTQSPQGYSISAVPKSFGSTGRRTFYSDQTGIIRQNWTAEPATDKSDELK
jgi:type IV pilus assembly protein PilA